MKKRTVAKSRILDTVHEAARGLYSSGFIDKRRMQEYDILCLSEVPDYSPSKIKALRQRYNISQAVLAAVINTSLSTICKWEAGDKQPSGPSLKLLNILDKKGIEPFANSNHNEGKSVE